MLKVTKYKSVKCQDKLYACFKRYVFNLDLKTVTFGLSRITKRSLFQRNGPEQAKVRSSKVLY